MAFRAISKSGGIKLGLRWGPYTRVSKTQFPCTAVCLSDSQDQCTDEEAASVNPSTQPLAGESQMCLEILSLGLDLTARLLLGWCAGEYPAPQNSVVSKDFLECSSLN